MRELRLVLLGLAAVLALLLGVGFLARAIHPPAKARVDVAAPVASGARKARAIVETAIADAPDYTRFFDRLRLAFPSDYDRIVDMLTTSVEKTGGEPNVDLMMTDAVAALRRAHGSLAAKASDEALGQIFAMNLREMQALSQLNPGLCVSFLFGASGSGFLPFAADHRALVADAAIAGLDAMSSGRLDNVSRGAPDDGDFQALDHALDTRGLTRPEIEALLDGKTADPPIPDAAMCQAGQTYLATLATLPADTRGRLYGLAVDLMAKS